MAEQLALIPVFDPQPLSVSSLIGFGMLLAVMVIGPCVAASRGMELKL